MVCSKCGATFEDETLKVCPVCGEALETNARESEIVEIDEKPALDDVEKETIEQVEESTETVTEENVTEEEEVDEEELRRFKLDEIQARREAKLKKEQHKKIVGAVILVIAIIAIAAGGLWFLAENSDIFKNQNVVKTDNKMTESDGNVKKDEVLTAGEDLAGATIKALEVVVSPEDLYYIKFSYGEKHYLARINYGTTEDQIKDNLYVVDAHADEEYKVDGKVAYVLDTIFNGHKPNEDILEKSANELLTPEDIADLDSTALYFARNEIYARHGKKFNEKRLDDFFAAKEWFVPAVNFNDSILTATELNNAEFILEKENEINGN